MDIPCPTCRTPSLRGDRYCASCGESLVPPPSKRRAVMDDDFIPLPLSVPTGPEPPRRSRRRAVFVVVGIGLVAAVAMAVAGYDVIDFRGEGQSVAATVAPVGADEPADPSSSIHDGDQAIDDSDADPGVGLAERDSPNRQSRPSP
jgi:hypothetical protein